jgi:hypothetical protein
VFNACADAAVRATISADVRLGEALGADRSAPPSAAWHSDNDAASTRSQPDEELRQRRLL